MSKKIVKLVAWVLVIIGALNWGLVGAFDLDLVEVIFGLWPMVVTIVYILVGLSAVVLIALKAMKGMKMKKKK